MPLFGLVDSESVDWDWNDEQAPESDDPGVEELAPEEGNQADQVETDDIAKLKARARTEKARQAALVNKLKRKFSKSNSFSSTSVGGSSGSMASSSQSSNVTSESQSWAKRMQEVYLTPRFHSSAAATVTDPFGDPDYQKIAVERGRCVMSLMLRVVNVLVNLLTPFARQDADSQDNFLEISQVLNVCVMDDTSTRLKGNVKGDNTNVIHGIMNTVQSVHVLYNKGDHDNTHQLESFLIPTPMYCLASSKTEDLYAGYSAYMLLSSAGVGYGLKALQCPPSICQAARWRVHALVGDALPTNDAMFKVERRLLLAADEQRRLGLRVKCFLHQISLVRKMGVLCFDSFWPSLVRLSHLFESFSFKKKFSLALVQVLSAPGAFQRAQVVNWCLCVFVGRR